MKSSKSKRKLTTEDICKEYYESQIFRPTGNDEVSPSGFFANASICLEAIDASFKGIDFDTFLKEMITVNIELFGLAWLNHNYELNKAMPESSIPEEIAFTKQYLQDTGRGDIWERMSLYNDEILKTIAEETVISESWGCLRDISVAIREEDQEEIAEKWLMEKIRNLTDLFGKYSTDSECRDRLVTRFLYIPCGINRITALSQKFSLKLSERLGCDLKKAGLFTLQRIVVGLYDNAVNYLDAVQEWGSYEAAKDALGDLLEGLHKVARQQQQK